MGCDSGAKRTRLLPGKFAFFYARNGDEANDSLRVFENQSSAFAIHYRRNEPSVRLGNPAMRGRCIVAGEFALFHAGNTDEADHARGILKDQSGPNLVSDGSN